MSPEVNIPGIDTPASFTGSALVTTLDLINAYPSGDITLRLQKGPLGQPRWEVSNFGGNFHIFYVDSEGKSTSLLRLETNGNLTVGGGLTVSGGLTMSGGLGVVGDLNVGGAVGVGRGLNVRGPLKLSDVPVAKDAPEMTIDSQGYVGKQR